MSVNTPILAAHRGHRGGRPTDHRRLWDAIFWIACARTPWRSLPEALGRPDTAHRALRRAARDGLLRFLLLAVSDLSKRGELEPLRWRIARACRRVAKVLPLADVLLADRLGLPDALPCSADRLPRPGLSETALGWFRLWRANPGLPGVLEELRAIHRRLLGDWKAWRLTA